MADFNWNLCLLLKEYMFYNIFRKINYSGGVFMKKFKFNGYCFSINCMLPYYDENGQNCTLIKLDIKDCDDYLDPRTIKTCIKAAAKSFAIDLEMVKKKFGPSVNRKTSIPIPLHPDLVFVPMKIRKAKEIEDGSWGYFSLDKISGYEETDDPYKSIISFNNGTKMPVILKISSIKAILNDAHIIKTIYRNLIFKHFEPEKVNEANFLYHV
jgi:hypothetical protein